MHQKGLTVNSCFLLNLLKWKFTCCMKRRTFGTAQKLNTINIECASYFSFINLYLYGSFFDKISTTKHHHRGSDALHQKLMSSDGKSRSRHACHI